VNLVIQTSRDSCTANLLKSRNLGVGVVGVHIIPQRNVLESVAMTEISIA
jgi:hypothetical protein